MKGFIILIVLGLLVCLFGGKLINSQAVPYIIGTGIAVFVGIICYLIKNAPKSRS